MAPRESERDLHPTPALAGPAAPAERPVATAEIVALVAEVGIPPLFQADTASRLADAGFTTEADVNQKGKKALGNTSKNGSYKSCTWTFPV